MDNKIWPDKFQQSGLINVTDMDNNLLDNTTNTNNNENECNRNLRIQQDVQSAVSEKSRQKIQTILEQVNTLVPIEKLLLYLKLPTETGTNVDPLRQSLNPLGSRSEIHQTIMWIKTHLEEDPELSLQKEGVYLQYSDFCESIQIKALSTADFGKVMKQVYPKVKPRRLGIRGQSKYCYSGLRRRVKLARPLLPDLAEKPLSTEVHCSESDLMAAAWIIIKEWSESKLNIQFQSVPALAFYLVSELDVGTGSQSANIVSLMKEDLSNSFGYINKHRETTLQLQRKLHQKSEGLMKDHKRKQLQSPRFDQKSRPSSSKKLKISSASTSCSTSPVIGGGQLVAANNMMKSSPPSQEHSPAVCDSTNLQTLPDFNCFQRLSNTNDTKDTDNGVAQIPSGTAVDYQTGKVAIPRITPTITPVTPALLSPSKQRAKNKQYKAIQPKPNTCDRASYNPKQILNNAKDLRAHQEPIINRRHRLKHKKEPPNLLTMHGMAAEASLLTRERLISLGQVDKDELDEYMGGNNQSQSQEQPEEEIMQLMENNNEEPDKISQLRQLLLVSQLNKSQPDMLMTRTQKPMYKPIIPPNIHNLSAKRRVSFDTQEVPPSPNTRRQNFNFTPISAPLSPKCSSSNASPFVSPRNTPVIRARSNALINNARKHTKDKFKPHILELVNGEDEDLFKSNNQLTNLPMSAPPSPKINPLLNIYKNCVNYQPNFNFNDPHSPEVSQLITNNIPPNNLEHAFRSQSVPLGQNQFFNDYTFNNESINNPTNLNEFNDLNEFNSDNINVNKIIDEMDTNPYQYETPGGVVVEPNLLDVIAPNNPIRRSQSIDVHSAFANSIKTYLPSRSVPSTPIPYSTPTIVHHGNTRRSYPTTPAIEPITYHTTQDFLLNGQPIKDDKPDQLNFLHNLTDLNDDKQDGGGGGGIADFGDSLVDSNFGAKAVNSTAITDSVDDLIFRQNLPE